MGSFFSVRLAPGVRLSASSRGLRAHVGPRMARLHVGGGGTGVSTGAGPFTFYQGVGGSSRRTSGYYPGPTALQVAQASKEQVAQQVQQALAAIARLHLETFPPSQKRTAEVAPPPAYPSILHVFERQQLKGIPFWQLGNRREARARARTLADERARIELERVRRETVTLQADIDRSWAAFLANDSDLVLAALEKAFEDNAAPTAAVSVDGDSVGLVVLIPEGVIPDREVGTTPSGNLSVRKMTRTTYAAWYRELVAGHVLVSASEALAVAPGLARASVVACRRDGARLEPVLAATLERRDIQPQTWGAQMPWATLTSICQPVCNMRGRTGELRPIDADAQPEIAALVDAFEADV